MNQEQIDNLLKREDELLRELAGLRERLKLDATLSNEDRLQRTLDAREAAERIESVTQALKACQGALLRWETGIGDRCRDCSGPISPARLQIVPSASRCIVCQSLAERRGKA